MKNPRNFLAYMAIAKRILPFRLATALKWLALARLANNHFPNGPIPSSWSNLKACESLVRVSELAGGYGALQNLIVLLLPRSVLLSNLQAHGPVFPLESKVTQYFLKLLPTVRAEACRKVDFSLFHCFARFLTSTPPSAGRRRGTLCKLS